MDAEAGEFEAVKELERLRAERDRLEKQLALEQQASAALRERVEVLREALMPLALFARRVDAPDSGIEPIHDYCPLTLWLMDPQMRDARRAAELLASTEGGS